jgi:hypothetical protein
VRQAFAPWNIHETILPTMPILRQVQPSNIRMSATNPDLSGLDNPLSKLILVGSPGPWCP